MTLTTTSTPTRMSRRRDKVRTRTRTRMAAVAASRAIRTSPIIPAGRPGQAPEVRPARATVHRAADGRRPAATRPAGAVVKRVERFRQLQQIVELEFQFQRRLVGQPQWVRQHRVERRSAGARPRSADGAAVRRCGDRAGRPPQADPDCRGRLNAATRGDDKGPLHNWNGGRSGGPFDGRSWAIRRRRAPSRCPGSDDRSDPCRVRRPADR